MALVVQHDNERVEPLPVKHGIGAERTRGSNAFCRGRLDCRLDEVDLLPAEQTVFAGVRVKAADRYFWGGNAAALERPICGLNDVQDFLARDQGDRLLDALVQGAVDDPSSH